jgi:hypothetical protein
MPIISIKPMEALAACALLLLCTQSAAAQSIEARLSKLEARVAALEGSSAARQSDPAKPTIGSISKMFGPMRLELMGCYAAGGDSGKAKCRFVVTNTGAGPTKFSLWISSVTNDDRQSDSDSGREVSAGADNFFHRGGAYARYLPGQEIDGIMMIGSDKAPLYKNIRSMVLTINGDATYTLNNVTINPSAR